MSNNLKLFGTVAAMAIVFAAVLSLFQVQPAFIAGGALVGGLAGYGVAKGWMQL